MSEVTMRIKGAPTISDVAQRAGVNRVTASVVLNNAQANTRVSEATRERILAAAAEVRYQPNAVAQSLRRRRTNIIGFYSGDGFSDARNPFVSHILSGLQKGCEAFEKDFLVHRHNANRPVEEVYGRLVNGQIDGLILFAPNDDSIACHLASSHLPVITVTDAVSTLPSVVVDDWTGGRLQAEHLASKGHRHVLYERGPQTAGSVVRRFEAFREASALLGITVTSDRIRDGYHTLLSDEGKALVLAGSSTRPTAIVCWEDMTAYRVLAECLRLGLRVPDDVAIVGFDGIMQPIEPIWQVTTVRAPWREVAYTAVTLLISQIEGQIEGKEVPIETVLPVNLIVGNTT